jgi:hypothetical protein
VKTPILNRLRAVLLAVEQAAGFRADNGSVSRSAFEVTGGKVWYHSLPVGQEPAVKIRRHARRMPAFLRRLRRADRQPGAALLRSECVAAFEYRQNYRQ